MKIITSLASSLTARKNNYKVNFGEIDALQCIDILLYIGNESVPKIIISSTIFFLNCN